MSNHKKTKAILNANWDTIVAMKENGESIKTISKKFNVSRQTLEARFKKSVINTSIECPALKILTLDIENAPMLSYHWGLWDQSINPSMRTEGNRSYMMSVAAKWLHSDEIFYFETRTEDDSEITASILKLIDDADIIVGHNVQRFDMKKINAYAILNGLKPPSPYRIIDTMLVAKKFFSFERNTLDYLTNALCTVHKSAHKKFNGFELWSECIKGNEEAWDEMRHYNCLTPTHKVLTEDLRWTQIGDLKIGAKLLGFDEHAGDFGRNYREAVVIGNRVTMAEVFKVTLSNGDTIECTEDHKWLASPHATASSKSRSHGTNSGTWVTTRELIVNGHSIDAGEITSIKGKDLSTAVYKNFDVISESTTKEMGWLAGMFDGEGSLYNRKDAKGFGISITQKVGPELDKICELLDSIEVTYHKKITTPREIRDTYPDQLNRTMDLGTITLTGGYVKLLRFLQIVRPERLIAKLDLTNAPRMENRYEKVLVTNVEFVGTKEIVILETTTATYIADGYSMHNCQDVVVTEELYLKLRPYIKGHPNIITGSGSTVHKCTACGSTDLTHDGYSITNVSKFQRYRCLNCGSFSRDRKNLLERDERTNLLTPISNG